MNQTLAMKRAFHVNHKHSIAVNVSSPTHLEGKGEGEQREIQLLAIYTLKKSALQMF